MDNTFQYDTQRTINNGGMFGYNFANVNGVDINNVNPPAFNTNDPTVLCISGNAFTIKSKG
jgi:predicted ThiF/HesA family dinucleotide-utilizing enzyme